MKIIQVRFKNIHSLKGEHTINFEDGILGDAGLFAITGPTGSGKSTILDVITLALYNRVPRLGNSKISKKIIEEQGMILTKHASDCFAEVVYESQGKRYRSSWSISRNRNNNLNDRIHELIDDETGEILEKGKSDVAEENERIIGLSYEQFVQSLILAQGEFTKLLLAKRHDRNKLLETLTGANIYRKIGIQVFNRFSQIDREVKDQELRMQGVILLTADELSTINKELNSIKPELNRWTVELKKLRDLLSVKEQIASKEKERLEAEKKSNEIRSNEKDIESARTIIAQQNRLSPFKDQHHAIQQLQKDERGLKSEIQRIEEQLNDLKTQQENGILEATDICQSRIANHELIKTLDEVLSRYEALDSELREIKLNRNNTTHRKQEINADFRRLKVENIPSTAEQTKVLLHETKQSLLLAEIHTEQDLKIKQLENYNQLERANSAILIRKQIDDTKKDIKDHIKEKAELQKQIETTDKQIPKITAAVEKTQKKLATEKQRLDHANKTKALEEHRKSLVSGEPCPLCGALEHPLVQNYNQEFAAAQQALLKQIEDNLALQIKELRQLESNSGGLRIKIESIEKIIAKSDSAIAKNTEELKPYLETLNWTLSDDLGLWESALNQLSKNKDSLEQHRKNLHVSGLLEQYHEVLIKLSEQEEKLLLLTENRDKIYKGNDLRGRVETLKQQHTTIESTFKVLSGQMKEKTEKLRTVLVDCEEKTKDLLVALSVERISTIAEFDSKLITEDKIQALREKVATHELQKSKIDTTLEQLQKSLEKLRESDNNQMSIELVKDKLVEAQIEYDKLNQEKGKLDEQIAADDKKRNAYQSATEHLKKLQLDRDLWKQMNSLIGDKNGNQFANFVQDLTLAQLIDFANQRLLEFADRYQLTKPNKTDGETLQVVDTYMGNTMRSVTSLSGGETFKLSLALAFGLSDLAAKNVNIESLFIDEGFGTLDPESLDQAISILEKMQNENNKSIGIISHVGELKERISAKIKLIRTGAGYSTIEIGE